MCAGRRAVAVVLCALVSACIPSQWRVRDAETNSDAPDAADALAIDAIDAAPDAPTPDSPPSDGPMVDSTDVAAPDVAPPDVAPPDVEAIDVRDVASEPDAGPEYDIDFTSETVLDPPTGVSPPEGTYLGQCTVEGVRGGFLNGLTQARWPSPTVMNTIGSARFLCARLGRGGVTTGPIVGSPTAVFPASGGSCQVPPETTVREYCPAGFIMVGVQGDTTVHDSGSGRFIARMTPVCARFDAWMRLADEAPSRDGGFFSAAFSGPAAPMGASHSIDTLAPFYSCDGPVPAEAPACSFPPRSGNTYTTMGAAPNPRAFFSVCAGGSVPTSFRLSSGCVIDQIQFNCSPVRAR